MSSDLSKHPFVKGWQLLGLRLRQRGAKRLHRSHGPGEADLSRQFVVLNWV